MQSNSLAHHFQGTFRLCNRIEVKIFFPKYIAWQCKRCGLGNTRLRHPSLPFDSLPYSTRTIRRRVRTYARSIMWQPNEKRLTIIYEYGALSHARFARVGAPLWNGFLAFWLAVFSMVWDKTNRPFPSSSGPLYHNEVKCSGMEMIFHSHANKTHFHMKRGILGLIL